MQRAPLHGLQNLFEQLEKQLTPHPIWLDGAVSVHVWHSTKSASALEVPLLSNMDGYCSARTEASSLSTSLAIANASRLAHVARNPRGAGRPAMTRCRSQNRKRILLKDGRATRDMKFLEHDRILAPP
jgi:hypothetical protein